MLKNLKYRKRNLEKAGKVDEALKMNFFPVTYQVPREYSLFQEEFKRFPNSLWIMKPVRFHKTNIHHINRLESHKERESSYSQNSIR